MTIHIAKTNHFYELLSYPRKDQFYTGLAGYITSISLSPASIVIHVIFGQCKASSPQKPFLIYLHENYANLFMALSSQALHGVAVYTDIYNSRRKTARL